MNFLVFGIYDLFRNGIIRRILNATELPEGGRAALLGGGFLLCIAVAYLLGSINWALVISRVVYHDDVRRHGSGNAGTTNILRTYGRKAAIFTFVGDTLKGAVAVLFACLVFGFPASEPYYLHLVCAAYLSAFFCIFGHVFPCFSHFKGGKGFATMAGVILVLDPVIFLILFAMYVPLVLMSHYVSLSSIIAAMFYPVLLSSFDSTRPTPLGIHALIVMMIAALIVWCHRSNIKRLLNHTENKIYLKKSAPKQESTTSENEE